MIQQDYISKSLSLLAVCLLIFLSTFGSDILVRAVFMVVMILSSWALSAKFKIDVDDPSLDRAEGKQMVMWAVISFFVIMFLNSIVPKLPLGLQTLQAIPIDSRVMVATMLAMLIAIAEEQFFRGLITNLLVSKLGSAWPLAILMSGAFFAIYHFAVYGTSASNLIIVAGSGMVLSLAAYKTRRVSTTMGPHLANNFLSSWSWA